MPAPPTRRRKRVQDKSTAETLRAVAGEEIAFGDGDASRDVPRREALAYLLWAMALRGNLTACRLLLEYMDGKPGPSAAAARTTPDRPELTADELARAEKALEAWREETRPGPGHRDGVRERRGDAETRRGAAEEQGSRGEEEKLG